MYRCKCNPNESFKSELCPYCKKPAVPAEQFRSEMIDNEGRNRPKLIQKGKQIPQRKPVKIERDFK